MPGRVLFFCTALVATLVAPLAGASPAEAQADVGSYACTVSGGLNRTFTSLTPAPVAYDFALTFQCTGVGDDAGTWTIGLHANGVLDSCAQGTGTGYVVSQTSTPDGGTTGGGFDYVRVYDTFHIAGEIDTTDEPLGHPFSATLAYVPFGGAGCPESNTGSITGSAVIQDGVVRDIFETEAVPCAASGVMGYQPAAPALPASVSVLVDMQLTCLGVGGLPDDSGSWGLHMSGAGTVSCGAEVTSVFIAPTGLAGGDGGVTGGGGQLIRSGVNLTMKLTIYTSNDEVHDFVAHVGWAPQGGPCPVPQATISGPSVVTDV